MPSGIELPVGALSSSLDAVAMAASPVQEGGLLSTWHEINPADLPPTAREVAAARASPREILEALVGKKAIRESCSILIEEIKTNSESLFGSRVARVSLARLGLLTGTVPTLEDLGFELGVSRERVRQLEMPASALLTGVLTTTSPPALCLRAWFDVHPGEPLSDVDVDSLAKNPAHRRCLRLVLYGLRIPWVDWEGPIWAANAPQARALDVLLSKALFRVGLAEAGWTGVASAIKEQFPELREVLEVEATLRRLGSARGFGPGIDGRLERDLGAQMRRVARKIVTYLSYRAHSIALDELAQVIREGWYPFEVFHRPHVTVEWLRQCIEHEARSLALSRARVSLAPDAQGSPPGVVGTLHAILVTHGGPIRMQDLCDQAAEQGISRNQVTMLIHSRRAACLLILARGIVGLVGRDEAADPESYAPARPSAQANRVRPGNGIWLDDDGALVADMMVRRSVREQGFGLPWPFSLVLLDERACLLVDGEPRPICALPNGSLEADFLQPGFRVRVRLRPRSRTSGTVLEVSTGPLGPSKDPVTGGGAGTPYATGLPPENDRPQWVSQFLAKSESGTFTDLTEVARRLPSAFSQRRRIYAAHGLAALGVVVLRRRRGWIAVPSRRLPSILGKVFREVGSDPYAYHGMGRAKKAAARWLVRAGWMTPSLGWTSLVPNELGPAPDREPAADSIFLSAGDLAVLRLVEAAGVAEDHREHPGGTDPLKVTKDASRRFLTALGFTAFEALSETGPSSDGILLKYRDSLGVAVGVWKLRPVGSPIRLVDLEEARAKASRSRARAWGASNGVQLHVGSAQGQVSVRVKDLRAKSKAFADLVRISGSKVEGKE